MRTITLHCPHCQSDALVRNGHAPNGKQLYRWKCQNSDEDLAWRSLVRYAFMRCSNASSKAGTNWPNSSSVKLVTSRNCCSFWLTCAYLNSLIDSLPALVFPQSTITEIKSTVLRM